MLLLLLLSADVFVAAAVPVDAVANIELFGRYYSIIETNVINFISGSSAEFSYCQFFRLNSITMATV